MQFRERRRVIQVIRTVYDKEKKRGRSQVVGKIDKATPALTDKLRKHCTAEEVAEIGRWLESRTSLLRDEAARLAAAGLPEQIRLAAQYFRTSVPTGDEAVELASAIRAAWPDLKGALRLAGLSKAKLAKYRGKTMRRKVAAAEPAPVTVSSAELTAVLVPEALAAAVEAAAAPQAGDEKPAAVGETKGRGRRDKVARQAAQPAAEAAPAALPEPAPVPVPEEAAVESVVVPAVVQEGPDSPPSAGATVPA